MTKDAANFYGGLSGFIPAIWVGAYLFHIHPIEGSFDKWWSFPWLLTVLVIVVLVVLMFVLAARKIMELINEKNALASIHSSI